MPQNAWAIRSSPRSLASGPVWPKGEMRRTARRWFVRRIASGARPAASSPPGPWSSTTASAEASSFTSQGSRARSDSSATTDDFPRFSVWK